MFLSRSPDPVSISRVYVPLGVDTASATYPLMLSAQLYTSFVQKKKRKKRKKKRSIRSPVPCTPPSRSCSSTLTDSIRRPQCSSDVIGQSRYNLGCRPGIALDIGRGPAGKGNSGFQGVERQSTLVNGRCSRGGKETRGDDSSCSLSFIAIISVS